MPEQTPLVSQIALKVDGNDVPKAVLTLLVEVTVDQHAHLPGMFVMRFFDPGLKLLDEGPFDLTKEVEIGAETASGKLVTLIKGEITALEPEFKEGMNAELVVRGYDKLHRLYREPKSKAYLNTKDSELAEQIAKAAGLKSEVEATNTIYDHIYQHNQSDLLFLRQRAWRIGYECFVDEGKLYFRKPKASAGETTLTWGGELLWFTPRMTLAEQVDEVIVKGWDVEKKAAIMGKATKGTLYPQIGETTDGAGWANHFGAGKLMIVDQPVLSQEEANTLAAARLDELSAAFIEAEGEVFRRPDIKAGKTLKLDGLGKRFSGVFLVTHVLHTYKAEGLTSRFAVRGTRLGLLGDPMQQSSALDRWIGVVPAIVTNTDDPNKWGRVKVKFPWLTDEAESAWARVLGLGAGPEAGLCLIPQVDDEVLVTFVHGDFNQPIVLGGVWNGQHDLPTETANAAEGEKPKVRTWHSTTGHWLAMYDNADNKVELVTKGGHKLVLDDAKQKITLTSKNGHTITLDDSSSKISIESKGELEIKSNTNLKIEAGGNMDLKASGQVNVKGTMINLN